MKKKQNENISDITIKGERFENFPKNSGRKATKAAENLSTEEAKKLHWALERSADLYSAAAVRNLEAITATAPSVQNSFIKEEVYI